MNAPEAPMVKTPAPHPEQPARALLERLAKRGIQVAAEAVALVMAHPDDECLTLGAQLPRLKGLTIVHVTDGAPVGSGRYGFGSRKDYAAARRRELVAALDHAGIPPDKLIAFGVPDQEASLRLAQIARDLAHLLVERGSQIVLTHAYEGGHPDHDAVAFAVHAARRLAAKASAPIEIVEMPLYHADRTGWVRQRFPPASKHPEVAILLSAAERELKRRMLAAHATQADTLGDFGLDWERFSLAPEHDFTGLPNGGRLLYERYPWGMTGARWQELARGALAELGLEARRCA